MNGLVVGSHPVPGGIQIGLVWIQPGLREDWWGFWFVWVWVWERWFSDPECSSKQNENAMPAALFPSIEEGGRFQFRTVWNPVRIRLIQGSKGK